MLGAVALFTPTPASAGSCEIERGGHKGYYICQYPPKDITWPDGHKQTFVVGTDYAVWDIYQLGTSEWWSNWRSLGGQARSSVRVDVLTSSQIDIRVWGTTDSWWCKSWTPSSDWPRWWKACVPPLNPPPV
jgi:hypothetical protein